MLQRDARDGSESLRRVAPAPYRGRPAKRWCRPTDRQLRVRRNQGHAKARTRLPSHARWNPRHQPFRHRMWAGAGIPDYLDAG